MRYVVLQDDKIKALIDTRKIVVEELLKKQEEMITLDKELGKLMHKADRMNTKIEDAVKPYKTEELDEFEYYGGIGFHDGELRLNINDKIEDVKNQLRQSKEKIEE